MDAPFELSGFYYAHRGLWTPSGPPENSLPAFAAAAVNRYGIEFDVRPAADGTPVLFHDPDLDRMTDETGPVWPLTARDMADVKLKGSDALIPSLADLLRMWPRDLPLLTELKIDGKSNGPALARSVAPMLKAHGGLHAMMSFDEATVAAVPDGIFAGQLHYPIAKTNREAFEARLERAINGRASYICVWHEDASIAAPIAIAAGLPLCVYTVRSGPEQVDLKANAGADVAMIFEGYDPRLA